MGLPEKSSAPFNIGDLAGPVTTLIERVSDAIGGYFKPWQIVRVAKAEAKAAIIKAQSDQMIETQAGRAQLRVAAEQLRNQSNIETVLFQALPNVNETAKPEEIENDWLVNFFDKARLYSDEGMQQLWSQVLAGEANTPGSFSRRTVNLLANLSKEDAVLFRKLCSLLMTDQVGRSHLFVLDFDSFYPDRGITDEAIAHLISIGLAAQPFPTNYWSKPYEVFTYFGRRVRTGGDGVNMGEVMLTEAGRELARVCQPLEDLEFFNYLTQVAD